ncbi:hypothetical protein NQ318_000602, partial [Aromia moschata]
MSEKNFLTRENVKPAEILRRLQAQFGNESLSWPRVKVWCKEFNERRNRVENVNHPRRPRTSISPVNIAR